MSRHAERNPPQRPSIGLALGGGAARGFAHIGVMRTLSPTASRPTSSPALRSARSPAAAMRRASSTTFEEWARSLTRRGVLSYLDVSLRGSGLIGGTRLAETSERGARRHAGSRSADPLRRDRDRNRHRPRDLADARPPGRRAARLLRAARHFPAGAIGGRWLVDGALVNPVPVSAARALGARVVIAVNLNADLFGRGTTIARSRLRRRRRACRRGRSASQRPARAVRRRKRCSSANFFGAAGRPGLSDGDGRAFNMMQDRITRARLAGDPPDVLISPRLGRVGLFDFHRAEEAIAHRRGSRRKCARSASTRSSRRCALNAYRGYAVAMYSRSASIRARSPRRGLHHVADRDDADEPALLDHRHMTEFARGHPLHDGPRSCRSVQVVDLARHHGADCPRAPPARARRARARCRAPRECRRRDRRDR